MTETQPQPRRTREGELPELKAAIARALLLIADWAKGFDPKADCFHFGAYDISPMHLAIWIRVATIAQRNAILADREAFEETMRGFMREAGYPEDCIDGIGFAAEAHEFVDLAHNGNWWYAIH